MSPAVEECHDAITPNDWKSDRLCAVSATLLYYGVWVVVLTCMSESNILYKNQTLTTPGFVRSLSLYMHLCWKINLGQKFKYISFVTIFGVAGPMVAIVFLVSGVSYQSGKICYINNYRSPETFWGPLLAIAGLALLLQLLVIGYCVYRVLTPLRSIHPNASVNCTLPARLPFLPLTRQVSCKIWHILQLQWRAMAFVSLIIFHIVFLAQVSLGLPSPGDYESEDVMPWMGCLIETNGDAKACVRYAVDLGPSKEMTMAAGIILSVR